MQRNLLLVMAVFTGTLLLAGDLWAQGTGGSVPSLFGSRTMGTATGPSGTLGGGGGGLGGLGSGLGGAQGLSGMLQGNLATGNERFVRGNQGGFIGADAAEVSAVTNAMAGAAAGRTNNRGGQNGQLRNSSGQNGRRTNQAGRGGQNTGRGGRGQRMVQPELRVAFRHPELVPATVSASLTARIQRDLSSRLGNVAGVEVAGRVVTLRGSVASRYDRIVAEKLVMLEPGVSRVRNELRVVPPEPEADQPLGGRQ
jgi:hypothetical protein